MCWHAAFYPRARHFKLIVDTQATSFYDPNRHWNAHAAGFQIAGFSGGPAADDVVRLRHRRPLHSDASAMAGRRKRDKLCADGIGNCQRSVFGYATGLHRYPASAAGEIAWHGAAALGASGRQFILLYFASAERNLDTGAALLSASLVFCGALGSAIVLAWLGRGFSIFPQARLLETHGPYRLVRHPLYLCEQISLFGVCMQYLQPWSFLIVLAGFGLQFPRMAYEEDILAQVFPLYADYAARTPKIIPGWLKG
jgi:protein-S-isoprenylcysteine O-methyltransferase Ste14